VAQAADFWKSVGARTLVIDPDTHDRAVAVVSHLPHLIADALMLVGGGLGTRPTGSPF
jgi:prephenate dehydrogenase